MNGPAERGMAGRINRLWWVTLPAAASRLSRGAAGVLGDGGYVAAVPPLGAAMPPALLVVGFAIGWLHPLFVHEQVYSASLVVMALMLAAGMLSAAWGAWLWAGYVLGDFFLYPHAGHRFTLAPADLLHARLPLLIPYVLLAMLLMFAPLAARTMAAQLLARRGDRGAVSAAAQVAAQAVLAGALVWVWAHSVPTLIRPVYTWRSDIPTTEAMQPLQEHGWLLVALGVVAAAVRGVAERRGARVPAVAARRLALGTALLRHPARGRRLPAWARVPLRAGFTTFMMAGLLATWVDAGIFLAVIAAILAFREGLAQRMGGWARLAARVPLLVRLAAAVLVSWLLTTGIITLLWSSTSTFRPVVLSVAVSLVVFFFLVPEPLARAGARPAGATEVGR